MESSVVTINTGQTMPRLGLGTFQVTKKGQVYAAVVAAVKAGYRLIDCASGYGNQSEIGQALKDVMEEGIVTREELFIVSKLFQTEHDWEGDGSRCHEALERTLEELQLDYLDLYLMHWPFAFEQRKLESPPGRRRPLRLKDGTPNPIWNIRMEYLQTWRTMETMTQNINKTNTTVKAIGVSNFTCEQLQHLIDQTTIVPAVNQIEMHPYFNPTNLSNYCSKMGIQIMAYSPLGSSNPKGPPNAGGNTLLTHPTVIHISEQIHRTPAQVLIRWSLQKGAVSIPKSSNPDRIQQNFQVFGWSLDTNHMQKLDNLHCNHRYFISYLKRPGNNLLWHDSVIEQKLDELLK